jgi:hypothetical protein
MSSLLCREKVGCPEHLARIFLEKKLAPIADSDQPETIRLAAPISGLRIEPATVVALRARAATEAASDDPIWNIGWSVPQSGAYPMFDGTLAVRADQDSRESILELKGTYTPPFGALGKIMDKILGSRVANATASALLETFAQNIERDFKNREDALRKSRPDPR